MRMNSFGFIYDYAWAFYVLFKIFDLKRFDQSLFFLFSKHDS